MEITLDELTVLAERYLAASGAPAHEIAVAVEMCLDAELRERRSHGVRLLRNIMGEYASGATRRRELGIERETPVSAVVDGGYHLSPFVHRVAVDLLIAKARASGIAVVAVTFAGVSGALGNLVERVADHGLVALAFNTAPAVVVPPGTTEALLSTNPLAIGVPRADGSSFVLDMATSAIAFNQVVRLRGLGEQLPEGVAVDEHGELTTDPNAALDASGVARLLPFGGHRGYGLSLMIELMVAGLIAGRVGSDKQRGLVPEPDDFGGLYLAFDPALLGDPAAGFAVNEQLVEQIVAAGGRIPGERSRLAREEHLRRGTVALDPEAAAILGIQERTEDPSGNV